VPKIHEQDMQISPDHQMWSNMLNEFILRFLKGPIHALDDDNTNWPEIEEVTYGFSGKADEHRRKQKKGACDETY
jgi:hypothetical protein